VTHPPIFEKRMFNSVTFLVLGQEFFGGGGRPLSRTRPQSTDRLSSSTTSLPANFTPAPCVALTHRMSVPELETPSRGV